MKRALLLGLTLTCCAQLFACSQPTQVQPSKIAQAPQDVRCRQVTPTGSHMSRRVCTSRAERQAQSDNAQVELEKAMEYQRNRAMIERSMRRETGRPDSLPEL